jgi:hypothetical protein
MLMSKENKSKLDEDLVVGTIHVLSGKTKADPNPDELETLKKMIKKNVPFLLRGYFTAYLLREILQANTPRRSTRSTPQPRTKVAEPATKQPPKQQPKGRQERALPEGARTLYLNIGKMKRLYTKELSQILQDALSIEREDIYSIRIHDKYSFISMSEENCEKAIEKINGMDIKGRTASITYSNKE